MAAAIGFDDKVEMLRTLETDCYRVAYVVLQDEALAADAAVKALLQLSRLSGFFQEGREVQWNLMKREAVRAALQLRTKIMKDRTLTVADKAF